MENRAFYGKSTHIKSDFQKFNKKYNHEKNVPRTPPTALERTHLKRLQKMVSVSACGR